MNNQYKYSGQLLTSRIAQEFIRELFAGQTAQRQESVRTVDEAHLRREGLPKRSKLHPVERVLSALKRSGQAENSSRGVWSIHPETTEWSGIKSLNEFINWTAQFKSKDYVFRGAPNETYRIQASAYRRPKEDDRNFKKFLEINKELIEQATLRGYDERNGRKLKDLEILASALWGSHLPNRLYLQRLSCTLVRLPTRLQDPGFRTPTKQ